MEKQTGIFLVAVVATSMTLYSLTFGRPTLLLLLLLNLKTTFTNNKQQLFGRPG